MGTERKIQHPLSALFCVLLIILSLSTPLYAKTLILKGELQSRIQASQTIRFDVSRKVDSLTFRFALPTEFSNKAVTQKADVRVSFDPEPSSVEEESDSFGNKFMRARWSPLTRSATIKISYTASITSRLTPMESQAQFPLRDIPKTEAIFLKSTNMVQSTSEEIVSLSKKLTSHAKTEYEAVQAILNWVSDNIKYTYNPPQYDALYTLRTASGNCQNFAHLSMALLRAAGIPSRIVGGISLKRQWKVPVGSGNYLVQDMGQGGHAWLEIYFSDLGWLSYDPQQSRQFTSTRHIKQTHGLDSKDINDSWSASPYLPQYSEIIEADFLVDEQAIELASVVEAPKTYIVSNNLRGIVSPADKGVVPPADREVISPPTLPAPEKIPPVEVVPPAPERVLPPAPKEGPIEFGNTEFPTLVDVYNVIGGEGVRVLDKETAEYVTSKYIYAQAFQIDSRLAPALVSLAMRKFGGDGTLFIDVVRDEGGKPGFSGLRSLPVFLPDIKPRAGYYWIDFRFPEDSILEPGRYWIVLRHSGEAIMNWFYIPGNPYGDGDDTRSTIKGYKWEDILNCDFVFKVKGVMKK